MDENNWMDENMMNVVRELSCHGSQERTTIGDKKCKMSHKNFSKCGIV